MCGIVGYIGKRRAAPLLLKGLRRLEYRGYDSAGMAVIDGTLILRKDRGKIEQVDNRHNFEELDGIMGIAHTRWATHGEPNQKNAHPHIDCTGDVAIVHNGIIENYMTLRELLAREGHSLTTDTDSEIIAHLIEKFYTGDLLGSVRKALMQVQGTYGLAIVHKNHDEIVVARNGSPLIIGVRGDETFTASDASAILEHTKKMIYLEDGEVASLRPGRVMVRDLHDKEMKKNHETIGWDLAEIEKAGFKHFMLKEIFEQSESIKNVMRGRLGKKIKLSIKGDIKGCGRVVIVACGTSWHAALIGRYLIEKIAKIPTEVDCSSEFRYRNPLVGPGDLVVFISQSGETADTLAALREAKKKGAKTMGIINVVGSTIARESETGIYIHAGPEIGVASTKAYTNQILALMLLALDLMQSKDGDVDEKMISEIKSLPGKIESVLQEDKRIHAIAREVADHNNFLYLGRGINYPTALEGALKLKEISYIHAEGYPAAEMKHGPIALIDENMPVVFIANRGKGYDKIISNMEEVKARRGKIIAIATEGDNEIKRLADWVIYVPRTADELTPLVNVIPLQLLAYHVADIKELDVDKPRNLAKSVTVE
ncbi:MAG: glutamine--fructose-6-phosphate transaminase (isomerizing) [Candidatus Aenigmatarchaeota archaeon]|nr:MAG: glutamine--fructose-6-phosphate transaminase (isomerizing) [Candidatus Aenigmarchaeota archaeon]